MSINKERKDSFVESLRQRILGLKSEPRLNREDGMYLRGLLAGVMYGGDRLTLSEFRELRSAINDRFADLKYPLPTEDSPLQ